ncbi:MAG: alpha/beta fold hydrolase [Alphaproteobacteria bacterium]|nr:alpha/beta fold hydrolase [Alphaproteobacteria bacterium]
MLPTLVLIPGLLNDEALWRHQIDALSDVARILVADVSGADSMGELARLVLAQAPERFAMAGLSMGGYIAQEIMRVAPQRVSRLALVSTNARADTEEQRERRRGFIALAEIGRFKGVTPRLLRFLIHPNRLKDRALTGAVLAMAERVGKETFVRQQMAIMGRKDGRADLAAIACPTLILCGRQDTLSPVEIHQEMAAAIPNARLVVIEDAAHLTALEQPQAVNAALREWLREPEPGYYLL